MVFEMNFAMKRILAFFIVLASLVPSVSYAQIKIGNRTVNVKKAVQAASDMTKAVTLSDEDIAQMSRESVAWMDEHNPIDTGEYAERLSRLTGKIREIDGLPLNFKVYYVTDINAFACGDGSIRVFSSLMDIMDDDELMAIIGHEIGHVVHHDVKDAMKNAYMASAALNAAGAAGGKIGQLSDSQLGDVVTAFMDARFSQKQEYAADDYGVEFCVRYGFSPYGMSNALQKLVELSNGAKASLVQKMFSSHPDSGKRAVRAKEKADSHMAGK